MQRETVNSKDRRLVGAILLVGSFIQLAAASLVDPKVFMSPDPLVKLDGIARKKTGWTGQAVLFPVAFAIVTSGFGLLARLLRRPARWWGIIATGTSALSTLLWLPLTIGRLQLGDEVDQKIQMYESGMEVDLAGSFGWAFWPYTWAALTSIASGALALQVSGLGRRTGAGVFLCSVIVPATVIPRWRDWPPFASYLLVGIMGIRLLLGGDER
jgi:hypothetical protein